MIKSNSSQQVNQTTDSAFNMQQLCGRPIEDAINTFDQLQSHYKIIGANTVRTRFPPEPNGYLHLGHLKAINVNFFLAHQGATKSQKSGCILRLDDTNPSTEKTEFTDSILENLKWLGYSNFDTTNSSDYFQVLYDYAMKLITMGFAYVDHQTALEIKTFRENKKESPWRNRPVSESVFLFESMKNGFYDEGNATLRLKVENHLSHLNPQMSGDIVAYRIKYDKHPTVGNEWCIYPTYDFSHCIIDSLEHITHSFCTLEFEVRRESYYWLLNKLNLYKPTVWEYSRLNLEYTVMSKRCLSQLVNENHVKGWDDPRMPTINGLRRRGYTAQSIKDFCNTIGVSRTENIIKLSLLEHCARISLDSISQRFMIITDPVLVNITNWTSVQGHIETNRHISKFPKDLHKGCYELTIGPSIYIERSDLRLIDEPSFFGLAPEKIVHLKYAYNIKCTKIHIDDCNNVTSVDAEIDVTNAIKPKGKITWVNCDTALNAILNDYDVLFTSVDPLSSQDWLANLNPYSLITNNKAKIDRSIVDQISFNSLSLSTKFHVQFERLGYYVLDNDASDDRLIFNRTVSLKECKQVQHKTNEIKKLTRQEERAIACGKRNSRKSN